ncbi:uncharacterized protein LOC125529876, partial [Triticum urartu]|uniref:uncharacterized protein LOC125529876 n=1 Tax=Triticum urartu TaxID=4572 RepID=UPI0020438E90
MAFIHPHARSKQRRGRGEVAAADGKGAAEGGGRVPCGGGGSAAAWGRGSSSGRGSRGAPAAWSTYLGCCNIRLGFLVPQPQPALNQPTLQARQISLSPSRPAKATTRYRSASPGSNPAQLTRLHQQGLSGRHRASPVVSPLPLPLLMRALTAATISSPIRALLHHPSFRSPLRLPLT